MLIALVEPSMGSVTSFEAATTRQEVVAAAKALAIDASKELRS